jgi:hypothetical protein
MGRNENNVLQKIPIGSRFDSHGFGFVPDRAKPSGGERSDGIEDDIRVRGLSARASVWRSPSPEACAEFIIGRRFAPTRWLRLRPLPCGER